ncbi:MAG: cytochrome d ubiquinol oxidase subunit II [Candidatus Eisenbacteria bacterium]|uniref:Cytochrome d ubiquinol oxidase subunit II n=1 Tax=Eiseniibacteriota bacterium TaxID=2212470 RepID=A0A849SRR6_UNCEI|nr:cytochrome d ubiquinol oxidase subunit II [Candidatus Eisenbacteria bacterium]
MPAPETQLALVILAALVLYALAGGADFGGGVWDLLANGPSARRQRELIAHAIGPIWEANHVWLILVVVLLFTGYPMAFAAIATALHLPLMLALIGIVLRGSAFTFRKYDRDTENVHQRWSRVFAIASVVTPVMFGVCVGAIASGRIRVDPATGHVNTDFVSAWLAPFPFAIGGLTLALFALLAATYLTLETRERELQRAFRARALGAAIASGAFAWLALALARTGAPALHLGLAASGWALGFHLATGVAAVATIAALVLERYRAARVLAVLQVTLVLIGWALAQAPLLVPPDLSLANAAAPRHVIELLMRTLAIGAVVLFPALYVLFRVFKRHPGT